MGTTVVAINNAANKARMHLVKPATDSLAPWTGIITLWLTLGIWYNCTNQFYIQQTLGAKSEWDARMGVVLTAFLKGVLAFMFVMPAIIAFALFGPGLQQDKVFIKLVHETMPDCSAKAGLKMFSKCLSLELADKNFSLMVTGFIILGLDFPTFSFGGYAQDQGR